VWLRNVPVPEPGLLGLAVGVVLHRLRPWSLPGPPRIHRLVGSILVAAGTLLVMRAVQAAGSMVVDDPDRLLTSGPYAVCRNPMYLGWWLLNVGVALAAGSGWMLVTVPPAALAVHRGVLGEEQRLAARFGDEFDRYQARVPRYLPSPAHGLTRRTLSVRGQRCAESLVHR